MAVVNLNKVWLNVALDKTDKMSFQNVREFKFTRVKDGDIRAMANGRLRAVMRAATTRTWEFKFELCTVAQRDWLLNRTGTLMCLRDDRRRRMFGTYFVTETDENTFRNDYSDIVIVFKQTTYNEAV